MGLGGSSTSVGVTRGDSVIAEGEERIERVGGASKNGSLGARARFGSMFEALSKGF